MGESISSFPPKQHQTPHLNILILTPFSLHPHHGAYLLFRQPFHFLCSPVRYSAVYTWDKEEDRGRQREAALFGVVEDVVEQNALGFFAPPLHLTPETNPQPAAEFNAIDQSA